MKSDSINELAAALSKAQSEIVGAKKDVQNTFFKSKYADLASVWDACRGPLTKNGLSVTQTFDGHNLITILMHTSGQWIDSSIPIVAVKQDPQGIGSAISYFRRYSLAAMVGVTQIDDDAESHVDRTPAPVPAPTPKPTVGHYIEKSALNETPFDDVPHSMDMGKEFSQGFPGDAAPGTPCADYVVTVGKFKGRTLLDIGINQVKDSYEYWKKKEAKGEVLSGSLKNDLDAQAIFLGLAKP